MVVFLPVVSVPNNLLAGAPTCTGRGALPTGLLELLPCPACRWLEPWCGEDDAVVGLGNRARGTWDGSRGKKLSANREFFFLWLFFRSHLSQGREMTCVLKNRMIYVRCGSFSVCRDVWKYEANIFVWMCTEWSCLSFTVWAHISFLPIAMCLRRLYFFTWIIFVILSVQLKSWIHKKTLKPLVKGLSLQTHLSKKLKSKHCRWVKLKLNTKQHKVRARAVGGKEPVKDQRLAKSKGSESRWVYVLSG